MYAFSITERPLTASTGKPCGKLWRVTGSRQSLSEWSGQYHDGNQCAVVDGAGQTGWFDVKSGVKQGCNMSGFLFLLVIDCIMRKTLEGDNTGIRWKLWTRLNDLDFADGIALISSIKKKDTTESEKPQCQQQGNWNED